MLLLLFLLSHPTINFVAVAPPAFPYVFQSFPLSLDTLPYFDVCAHRIWKGIVNFRGNLRLQVARSGILSA